MLAFSTWKRKGRAIFILDIDKKEVEVKKPSCWAHCWYDSGSIIFSFMKGGMEIIKKLDIASGKTSFFLKNIYDAVIRYDGMEYKNQVQEILEMLNSDTMGRNDMDNPKCFNGRIYFQIIIFAMDKRIAGVFSINYAKEDLKIHLYSNAGEIRDYHLFNDPDLIGIEWRTPKYEGVKYYKNNNEIDLDGYFPLNQSIFPTTTPYFL
jgi:hypothetical protein